ncbi:hypothetical protein EW146_g876 [Bondarzewia mesenterica]|uniref:F-box domain-containing protein n=1 Tax=Bondarzewia mesenterica TaxID=1095465 RepID=A0A4S4MBU7_9AGAM|nr:hypothetical protein EW146_g876 [Bondarzewia mesenterica]
MAPLSAISRRGLGLQSLPYDLLFIIVQHLNLAEVRALQLTCKSLRRSIFTRPVYRHLALTLLRRCRALPFNGFQRFSDISFEHLVDSVNKAAKLEHGWLTRTPRPSTSSPFDTPFKRNVSSPTDSLKKDISAKSWYKVVGTPPEEEIDWLSPITPNYTLCATKSGKVVCWDVQEDIGVAEWSPEERWELWKCRVEFERRTVFFTMAKIIGGVQDDKLMEFELMQIYFPEYGSEDSGTDGHPPISPPTPAFSHIKSFKMSGLVMNVFLLDPSARLLSGFVWIVSTNTIGLYVLLDWDNDEYIFVDTTIPCVASSNWSCILYRDQIVIHSEETDGACQHFYPLSLLRQCVTPSSSLPTFAPTLHGVLKPARVASRRFVFPTLPPESENLISQNHFPGVMHFNIPIPITDVQQTQQLIQHLVPEVAAAAIALAAGTANENGPNPPNPFLFPNWYPESAHFVRQWWPTMASVPGLSCAVVLLAHHHPVTHETKYVLSQHYFRVPLRAEEEEDPLMRMWYVSIPFEVVCVIDEVFDEMEEGGRPIQHPRPLLAVDFGHAVWIEHVDSPTEVQEGEEPLPSEKRLRFVSFPSVRLEEGGEVIHLDNFEGQPWPMEGEVRTLEIPEDLNLETVETVNIDQSQGAVILSVKEEKIFILCYE